MPDLCVREGFVLVFNTHGSFSFPYSLARDAAMSATMANSSSETLMSVLSSLQGR
jgi:hypothetical protein